MVNRSILWRKLSEQFGIAENVIHILRNLFDHNFSHLVVNGKSSSSIHNARGLLQGSSLSPILFNFYINDLVSSLSLLDKVSTCGMETNCLLFADDCNIHSTSIAGIQRLLVVCEDWSRRNDMRFSPNKCFYIGPDAQNHNLQLYGTRLPSPPGTEYLGMTFDQTGLNFESSLNKRTRKVRALIQMLGDLGMNSTGWPLRSSAMVYKSFIRPVLEYGLGLTIWKQAQISKVQKVQNAALRRIFSTGLNTSIRSMEKLLQLEPMSVRNRILNIKFIGRLHNCSNGAIPAVRLWRYCLQGRPNDQSFMNAIQLNPLWRSGNKLNHLLHRPQNKL